MLRVDTLQKLKAFLNIALETKQGDDMDNREIIECAFILADNRYACVKDDVIFSCSKYNIYIYNAS